MPPEAIERQNVTLFQVRIELLTGQAVLLSNMNVTVAFIGNELPDALVVPTVAVITQSGQSGVLVPGEGDRPRFRPVTLGSQAGNQIQILEGVEAGDRVFRRSAPRHHPRKSHLWPRRRPPRRRLVLLGVNSPPP